MSGKFCPGLTAAPLLGFAAFSTTTFTSSCTQLTGLHRLSPKRLTHSNAIGFPWLSNIFSVDTLLLSGFGFAALTILMYTAARIFSPVAPAVDALLVRVDAFALNIPRQFNTPLDRKSRPLGGTCTLLGAITFFTLSLVLVLQRESNNVNKIESVVALTDERRSFALAVPVFSAAPWGSGIQVRVLASGNGAVCASELTWSASNTGWIHTSTTSCGESSASQLVFKCADCALTPTSTLNIILPYSCQSLLIEAAAIDGSGAVTAFALPSEETTATPGTLLSSISWTLPTLLSIVNSSIASLPSARGYTLTKLSPDVKIHTLTPSSTGLAVIPTASTISIVISLPLNTFYAVTVLSEKQSITVLLSSIVGLAGVFGVFGMLLGATDIAAKIDPCKRKIKFASTTAVEERAVVQKEDELLPTTINPLHLKSPKHVNGLHSHQVHCITKKDEKTLLELKDTGEIALVIIPKGTEVKKNVNDSLPTGPTINPLHLKSPKNVSGLNSSQLHDIKKDEKTEIAVVIPKGAEVKQIVDESHATTINPLHLKSPKAANELHASQWQRVQEDGETWFECEDTGELTWVLPAGAEMKQKVNESIPTTVLPAPQADNTVLPQDPNASKWRCVQEDGVTWYECIDTDEQAWDLPAGAILED